MNLQEKSQNFFQNYAFFGRKSRLDERVGFGGRNIRENTSTPTLSRLNIYKKIPQHLRLRGC